MHIDLRKDVNKLRWTVPATFLGLLIYGMWAYIHKFCVKQLYDRRRMHSTSIGLIITTGVLILIELMLWLQIVVVGSGKQQEISPYRLQKPLDPNNDTSVLPPILYQCDNQGYPIWCPECQSIKQFRTHHSSQRGHCVERFDHFCLWLGVIIGRENYPLFVKFISYISCHFIIIAVSVLCYISHSYRDGNLLTIIVLAFLGLGFTLTLTVFHYYYICNNLTSIEMIQLQNEKKNGPKSMYLCYKSFDHEDLQDYSPCRYVVKIDYKDYVKIWNRNSIYDNWKDIMGEVPLTWILPFYFKQTHIKLGGLEDSKERKDLGLEYYNEKVLNTLQDKIDQGDYIVRFKAWGDQFT
ncbi:hypothetical protein MOUN0_K08790 [Monosporozyma unispora]